MKTIVIVGGIVLAGAGVIALVQMDKKKDHEPVHMQTQGAAESGSSSGTPLLNPEHGLAGHRCDLPVGAPLTTSANPTGASPSAANPAAIQQQIQLSQPSQNPGAPQSTPPASPAPSGLKINPAHGQPGHRCDIAVGAPLTSAPATNPVQVTQPKMDVQTQAAPAQTPPVSASGKVNPAHGQSNHRCDIPVGAPLT